MSKRKLSKNQLRQINTNVDNVDISAENIKIGQVVSHYGQQVLVRNKDVKIMCFYRQNTKEVVVGDIVYYNESAEQCFIVAIKERKNFLQRPAKYGCKFKKIAANIDQLIIVISVSPLPIEHYIDRYFVVAEHYDIHPILVLNKIDLLNEETKKLFKIIKERYESLGYINMNTSIYDKNSIDDLKSILKDKTSIFMGQSGVGKSALLNTIFDSSITAIGNVSEQNKRGRHTTTTAKSYVLPFGGELIDSPGIREFGIWHLSESEIFNGFTEFFAESKNCKFRNCNHHLDNKYCGIKKAVDDNIINQDRFVNYHRLLNEKKEFDTAI